MGVKINTFSLGEYKTKIFSNDIKLKSMTDVLIQNLAKELVNYQDKYCHIFTNNGLNLGNGFQNIPLTETKFLNGNTATIIYADSKIKLDELKKLYKVMLNNSHSTLNLIKIPNEKKQKAKNVFTHLPSRYDYLNNYYLYNINVININGYNLGPYTIKKNGVTIVPNSQPKYLVYTSNNINWIFDDDLDNSIDLSQLVKQLE